MEGGRALPFAGTPVSEQGASERQLAERQLAERQLAERQLGERVARLETALGYDRWMAQLALDHLARRVTALEQAAAAAAACQRARRIRLGPKDWVKLTLAVVLPVVVYLLTGSLADVVRRQHALTALAPASRTGAEARRWRRRRRR